MSAPSNSASCEGIHLQWCVWCGVVQGHYSAVTSLSLAPDGWSLISGGRDKVVHLWDLRKNNKLVTIPVYEAVEGATSLQLPPLLLPHLCS